MSSTEALSLIFLATGFSAGFGHCIGMCGPIVVSISLGLRGRGVLLSGLLYHSGRLTTYAALGGLMGMTGSFTGVTSGIAVIQKGVMIFAGVVVILMGLAMGKWIATGAIFQDYGAPKGFISKRFRRLSKSGSSLACYPLGLLLGLLPCGPVYTVLIASARRGMEAGNALEGFLNGMGLMLAFGLGTVPALLLLSKLTDFRFLRQRALIYRIGSVLMIGTGVYFVIRGIRY